MTKAVQLDVVELLKQVLQWTPLYKPGLNRALLQAAKIGSAGCVKVHILPHLVYSYKYPILCLLIISCDVGVNDVDNFVHKIINKNAEHDKMVHCSRLVSIVTWCKSLRTFYSHISLD